MRQCACPAHQPRSPAARFPTINKTAGRAPGVLHHPNGASPSGGTDRQRLQSCDTSTMVDATAQVNPAANFSLRHAGKIIGGGAIGATVIAIASLTFLPQVWGSDRIPDASPAATEAQRLEVSTARVASENAVRDLGLRVALGFGAVAAAIVAYGRLQLSRAEHLVSERRQANERWTTAVEQLGSDRIEVRLGGIYALEQFYRDVPGERVRTLEVLAAFVRSNLPPRGTLPEVADDAMPAPLPVDLQAGLTVLGGLARFGPLQTRIDLSQLNASDRSQYRANLKGVQLAGADLFRSNLASANLAFADLTGADLVKSSLADADLTETDLSDAD